eukprot:Sspe_Gene.57441::Locus_31523_Transcript_1_1_Confidence_1.000_Length_1827::g.57441::m.57441/K17606/IGBP1, TAP42; immunoglobulin-binding protein 1
MGSLGDQYNELAKVHTAIEQSDLDSADPAKQEKVKNGIELAQELWRGVTAAKVFSNNEERDDVATSDIRFFLVPYYLGDLIERVVDQNRAQNLAHAIHCFESFMKLCLDYAIISEKDYEALITPLNPNDRSARISRLKKQKDLQAKLAELSEKKKYLSRRISAIEETHPENDDEVAHGHENAELEATEREYWFLFLEDRLRAAAQQIQMARREEEMLRSLTQEQKDAAVEEYQKRIQESKGKAPEVTKIEKADIPVMCTQLPMDRQKIMNNIFVDRNPPTMSDEEYARQQMERMLPPDDPNEAEKSEDEDDEMAVDQKQLKARSWDDWKDDHPRDGNTLANVG